MAEIIHRELFENGEVVGYEYGGRLVRCKDCIHYWKNHPTEVAVCLASPRDDAYCSEGERKEDAND